MPHEPDDTAATRFGVAMITSVFHPSIGGAQTHTLSLSRQLQRRGVDVFVVTRHYRGLARFEQIAGVPTYRVGRGDSNLVVAALTYIMGALWVLYRERRRYRVLHAHLMISPMTIGLVARLLLRKPLIINPHRSGRLGDIAYLMYTQALLGRIRLAVARRWGNAFVAISPEIHAELRAIGVAAERIWPIANGVDIARFQPVPSVGRMERRAQLGLPPGPLALFMGRLVPEKGVDVLLAAWPTVLQLTPDATLALVGEGAERAALEKQARLLGIADHVRFVGGVNDVAPFYQAADVFVLPSRAEGLPVALLEAMACGLPCVATAISGTADLLEDGVTGRLVPVEVPTALAAGILAALTDPAAQRWSAAARQHVVRQYALDVVAERYLELYKALLGTTDTEQAAASAHGVAAVAAHEGSAS